ncbi:hypothetical protein [Serratia inhibens]
MIIRLLKVVLLGSSVIAAPLYGASMDITAEFAPDISNPSNNEFKNTTPLSGYCQSWPKQCQNNKFSINMGDITASLASPGFKANSPAREGMYFMMPGAWREVVVTNTQNGEVKTLKFRISAHSARYHTKNKWSYEDHRNSWNGNDFVNSPKPCLYSGTGRYSNTTYEWMWKWPVSNAACYKTATKDLTGEPYKLDRMSVGYELQTPNPLDISSGVLKGQLNLSVGPGGDIDFGDSFVASDSELILNFTLSVNHELKVSPLAEATNISLYPCYQKTSCTRDEAEKNWERWMVTNVTPQKMSGRSEFNLSSSGSFTVYMQCGSGAALDANRCPMTSGKSGTSVPVKATITLPENIADSAGQRVTDSPLFTEKNNARNRFQTHTFGTDKKGWVDFVIEQKDVKEMLKTRPDSWSGTVTLLFDPNLY